MFNHDIQVVNKVLSECQEQLEREKIEERFLQRERLITKGLDQALMMSQGKIKYMEKKIKLLQEIIKEKQG